MTIDVTHHYLGIDVGTGSARAAIFDSAGKMRGIGVEPIAVYRPEHDFYEHSSEDIWRACGVATRAALAQSGVDPKSVVGVGFDATCSMVALDGDDRPVTMSPTGKDEQNVIVWMDHRAIAEAAYINSTRHAVLDFVGGVISPEMQTPKLLWVKEHLPETWRRAARFFDLPDFLVYRATGVDVRSLCTTVCKWTYLGHEQRFDETYFTCVGLGELAEEKFARIGRDVRPMGELAGGLTEASARDLGLAPGTKVAVAIIDAHAGGLGLLGARLESDRGGDHEGGHEGGLVDDARLETRLALIGGTSSCHMAVSRQRRFVPGVWGPYYSAMVPGMWLTEGGQSATGALIDHTIRSHTRGAEATAAAKRDGTTVYALLDARLEALAAARPPGGTGGTDAERGDVTFLTREMHVLPDHHGNRSPRADPTLRGMVSGLRLDDSLDELALVYLATLQAIAHGTKHILEAMRASGHHVDTILACGGDTKNSRFVREHADVTGCRIVLPRELEAVLLGSAILGAVASGDFSSVVAAMQTMNASASVITPRGEVASFHAQKHRVFLRMHEDQMAYRKLMGS